MNPWLILGLAGGAFVVWQIAKSQQPPPAQGPTITLRLPDLSQVQLPVIDANSGSGSGGFQVINREPQGAPSPAPAGDSPTSGQTEQFVRLLNQYRTNQGLPEVVRTPLLDAVAQAHSDEMAREQYLSHTNRAGLSPFQRMQNAGYRGMAMAENVACGHPDAQATFEQWRTSPGHDANMRNPAFHAIGIAVAPSAGSCRYYWVNVFGDLV